MFFSFGVLFYAGVSLSLCLSDFDDFESYTTTRQEADEIAATTDETNLTHDARDDRGRREE